LPAVALLWLPLPLGLARQHRYRSQAPLATVFGLFRAWQNWVDLFRAPAGAFLLMALAIETDPHDLQSESVALYIRGGILGVGTLVQMFRFGGEVNIFAPLCYLSGLTLMVPGYLEGAFALLISWAFAVGTGDCRWGLPVMGVSLAAAGTAFDQFNALSWLTCGLVLLPPLIAVLAQKRILFVARERRLSQEPAAPAAETEAPKEKPRRDSGLSLKSRPSLAK
jgi:hypothetical protein